MLRLLLAAMATLFTCGQAFAAEQVQRYSFELHGGEPLTGSRYDQPDHPAWRFLDAADQFAESHQHEGMLGARLLKAWWNHTSADEAGYCRAFFCFVVEDPALQDEALSWLRQQDGVQADTIKPELADSSDPYVEFPPVDFIINGETYRYPGDFDNLERDWAENFALSNYPNQTMFIVHPPQAIAQRFGLGELSRADTFGDGQPIVINTLQQQFGLGDIVIPAGMELHPQFLPTHLVPDTDQGLRDWLLGEIGRRVQWYSSSSNGGAGKWEVYGFPLDMLSEASVGKSIQAAHRAFDEWLAAYPGHAPGGGQFGNVTLQTISADGRPVELLLRLYDMDLEGKYALLTALHNVWMYPHIRLATSDGLMGLGQPLEKVNQYGLKLANREGELPEEADLQAALDAYRDYRAGYYPPLPELPLEVSTDAYSQPVLMAGMPSMAELERMRGWLQAALPTHPDLSVSPAAWRADSMEQEAVSGFIEINGIRYQYPEDFADVQARNIESMLRYQPGGRAIALYSGIDFGEQNDAELAAPFAFGELAIVDIDDGGIVVTTIDNEWDPGIDISGMDLPEGAKPTMSGNMPSWIGTEPEDVRDYARRILAHSRSRRLEVMQQPEPRRYSIVINPLATPEQAAQPPGVLALELGEEQKQATRIATRISWETLLNWLEETEGYSADDAVMGEFDTLAPVTFQANDFGGFVQQIRIGVADASEEQLIELMDRICLATGIRDIWGRYNGNIYPSVVLKDSHASNSGN